MKTAQLSLAELGARLFAPSEACTDCQPPAGLSPQEVALWHLGTLARTGGAEELRAFGVALEIYEQEALNGTA